MAKLTVTVCDRCGNRVDQPTIKELCSNCVVVDKSWADEVDHHNRFLQNEGMALREELKEIDKIATRLIENNPLRDDFLQALRDIVTRARRR